MAQVQSHSTQQQEKIDFWKQYDIFDEMENAIVAQEERNRVSTRARKSVFIEDRSYFPSIADMNSYAQEDPKMVIPFIMWCEERLDAESRKEHKDEIEYAKKLFERYTNINE